LDWARNCALLHAKGLVIAYTDDDVVVDSAWLQKINEVFEETDVVAITGLIAPLELQTDSQLHFEAIGGFGRGCEKVWYRIGAHSERPDTFHLGAGRFGAGANMAFRASVLRKVGGFDPALDVGTLSEGGGDLEIFFRLLHEGYTLVYEPAALVWHCHHKVEMALSDQIKTWGTAMGAFLTAAFLRYAF
jgi:O-antigen biosynthesis protein